MSHYLVTGGCGFIGSHLVRALLAAGHRVTVIDDLSMGTREALPAGASLIVGDIRDHSLLETTMADAVNGCFHLAAIPSVERCLNEWFKTSEVNVLGTVAVFEAARKAKGAPIPVVYASSAAIYGADSEHASDESTAATPISSYGVDKLACEHYARVAWENYGLPNIGMRFFNAYGYGQSKKSLYSGVITCFMNALEQQQPITIFGDGEQTRDFIYVGDVVHALMAAMQLPLMNARIFNICSGTTHSLKQLASTMMEVYHSTASIEYQPARKGDIRHSCGDPQKALAAGVLADITPLKAGLERMIADGTH